MRLLSLVAPSAAVCLLAAGMFAAPSLLAAQAPQAGGPPAGGPGQRQQNFPKPTNLKVLDKNMSGKEVRDVMRKWEGDLGAECSTCHAEYDDHRKNERGQPQLDFAKDTKPEKEMARIMYKMTESIKADQIQKVKELDEKADAGEMNHEKPAELTCGTCHRGKENPEAYIPPKRENGPGAPGGPGGPGAPGMQGMPGMQKPPAGL